MTAQEIYIRIQNDLNSVGANRNRRYLPEQIELAVNTEQMEYIQNAFPEEPGIHFKPEQRYLDAVQGLIELKDAQLAYQAVELPEDSMRLLGVRPLESMSMIFINDCPPTRFVRPLTTRRVNNSFNDVVQTTAFYQDNDHEVTYTVRGNMVVFNDNRKVSILSVRCEYIRSPKKFSIADDQTLELSHAVHEEICDRVVQRIRERIGDPKFQSGLTQRSNTL